MCDEEKEVCLGCNGSGKYDSLDEEGNSIECSSCEGTGYRKE